MKNFLILFAIFCCLGTIAKGQSTGSEMIQFPITDAEYQDDGNGNTTLIPSQSMISGTYSETLRYLQLQFKFWDNYTKVTIYKNFNAVIDTAFHVSYGMKKNFDISEYGDGVFMVTVEPSGYSDVYYAQFHIINSMMSRFVRQNYYWSGRIHKQESSTSYQYAFDALTRTYISDTFSESFHFSGGTNHSIIVKSNAICNVYIFSENYLQQASYKYVTEWQNDTLSCVSASFSTPVTDDYRILIIVSEQGDVEKCECEVFLDNTFIKKSPVSDNYFDFPITTDQDSPYNVFVRSGYKGHADPKLYVIGESDKVVAFNDNYVSSSGFGWENDSRVILDETQHIKGVIVSSTPISDTEQLNRYVDVYVGCPVVHDDTNIKMYYDDYFENFDDIMISGPASLEYDHLAWAVGEKNYDDPYLKLFQFSVDDLEKPLAPIDEFLWRRFYTRDGATEENSCIDLYVTPDDSLCVYATIKAYWSPYSSGYAWESKVGTSERLFHPRYALKEYAADGDSINIIHYRRLHFTEINDLSENEYFYDNYVFGNVELTLGEENAIRQKVSGLKRRQINQFQTAYDRCKAILSDANVKSTKELLNSTEYSTLLSLCTQTPEFINYAYLNANNGDRLAFRLINDIAVPQYPSIVQQVKNYNKTHCATNEGDAIRYNVQANSVLFVKKLLEAENVELLSPLQGITYSNDDTAFTVNVEQRVMNINFALGKDAVVSLFVTSPDFRKNSYSLNRVSKRKGEYSITIPLGSSGLYTISCYVDGRFYEKKIMVK